MAVQILCEVEPLESEDERVKIFHERASGVPIDSLLQKILEDFASLSLIRDAHSMANDETTIRGI